MGGIKSYKDNKGLLKDFRKKVLDREKNKT